MWSTLHRPITRANLYSGFNESAVSNTDYLHYVRELYPVETALAKLNVTCKFILMKHRRKNDKYDVHFCSCHVPLVSKPVLYHPQPMPANFYAPCIYDSVEEKFYGTLLFSAFALISSLLVFWIVSRSFHLDGLTWDPFVIFSMIIGIANPRGPVHFGETLWFSTLVATGFLAGGEMIFGMTSVTISSQVERKVDTLTDLIDNNVTFVYYPPLLDKSSNDWTKDSKRIKLIELKSTRYDEFNRYLRDMICNKNVSLTTSMLHIMSAKLPQRLRIGGETLARESRVNEFSLEMCVKVERGMPWTEKFRYNFMKFHECYLSHLPIVEYKSDLIFRLAIGDAIEAANIANLDREDRLTEPVENYYLLLLTGCSLSLLVLSIEVIVFF